ncbi:MAG: replication initiation protein, partial [Candidatus Thiodiazotropha lotti]|nr:replication initiation protein [Candidatus Thiodiazotropha lotti]MCW4222065.1 replication initiation protein [Candidatus Thiodiazotropha lotti]
LSSEDKGLQHMKRLVGHMEATLQAQEDKEPALKKPLSSEDKKSQQDEEAAQQKTLSPGQRKVFKSNMLIDANYKLKLVEQRIILACIAGINPYEALPEEITYTAEEYAETFSTSLKRAYHALQEGTEQLSKRKLQIGGQDGKWFDSVEYLEGEAKILLRFSKHAEAHLNHLTKNFTWYELRKVAPLQSTYSIRLYELLIKWRNINSRTKTLLITVDEFKKRLGLDGQYEAFRNLKQRVIEPAIKELEAKSGIKFTGWEVKRKGRTAHSLAFRFKEKSLKGDNVVRLHPKSPSASDEPEVNAR